MTSPLIPMQKSSAPKGVLAGPSGPSREGLGIGHKTDETERKEEEKKVKENSRGKEKKREEELKREQKESKIYTKRCGKRYGNALRQH